MRTLTFVCAHCGDRAYHKTTSVGAYNVGQAMVDTGFFPLFSSWGDDVWLCSRCRKAAQDVAKILLDIVKNENLVLQHIAADFAKPA